LEGCGVEHKLRYAIGLATVRVRSWRRDGWDIGILGEVRERAENRKI
jgi:hypothetical protein